MRFAKMASAVFEPAFSHRKLLWCSSKAGVVQWVERELPKLGVEGSNSVVCSMHSKAFSG